MADANNAGGERDLTDWDELIAHGDKFTLAVDVKIGAGTFTKGVKVGTMLRCVRNHANYAAGVEPMIDGYPLWSGLPPQLAPSSARPSPAAAPADANNAGGDTERRAAYLLRAWVDAWSTESTSVPMGDTNQWLQQHESALAPSSARHSYVCPQCGPTNEMPDEHAERAHTIGGLLGEAPSVADCAPPKASAGSEGSEEAAGVVDVDLIGRQHPTNRYLFKVMCQHFGIELGKDRVDDALRKIDLRLRASPAPSVGQGLTEYIGHKRNCRYERLMDRYSEPGQLRRQPTEDDCDCGLAATLRNLAARGRDHV